MMLRQLIKILFLALLFMYGCSDDNGTEPEVRGGNDDALVGKWVLTSSQKNGNIVSHENFCDCPVEFQFNENGTGIVWKKDYGMASGCCSFAWSTEKDQLTIHEVNDYPMVVNYSVSGDQFTISYFDDGDIVMTYTQKE